MALDLIRHDRLLLALPDPHALPALVAGAGPRASLRFLEFFAAIRNPHTRRVYGQAVTTFLA